MTRTIDIRIMQQDHWPEVRRIYREGIQTKNATFEAEAPDWEAWNESHLMEIRFVAALENQIVGWAALSPVSERCVYAGVAEVSVYVDQRRRGLGIGKKLLQKLIDESEKIGLWTLQAGIFPENSASVNLHKRLGFREVGYREKIGQLDGKWRDVMLLERRSQIA